MLLNVIFPFLKYWARLNDIVHVEESKGLYNLNFQFLNNKKRQLEGREILLKFDLNSKNFEILSIDIKPRVRSCKVYIRIECGDEFCEEQLLSHIIGKKFIFMNKATITILCRGYSMMSKKQTVSMKYKADLRDSETTFDHIQSKRATSGKPYRHLRKSTVPNDMTSTLKCGESQILNGGS